MDNIFEVNTRLDQVNYVVLVNEIADGFYNDEDGGYQPHFGKINAMRLFYNYCVIDSKYKEKFGHEVTDSMDMLQMLTDDDMFIKEYNKALDVGSFVMLDFGNAYQDAMEIVHTKNNSVAGAFESVKSFIDELIDSFASVFTEENMELAEKIVNSMSRNDTLPEAIVDAYAQSEKFQNLVTEATKEDGNGNQQ